MRYAIHSISWGNSVGLDDLLNDVASARYTGIELFQRPSDLGGVDGLFSALQNKQIELIGICSGTFEERRDFVTAYAKKLGKPVSHRSVPYLYFDERIDDQVIKAMNAGYRVALHPHMYKPTQTLDEASKELEKYPKLLFLPDTAHLKIAGDDAVNAIEKFGSRLAAIHMKDWLEKVGRSYQFYGRGFCELGEGDIDLERVLNATLRNAPLTWLVVEQDRPPTNAKESAQKSRAWLARRAG